MANKQNLPLFVKKILNSIHQIRFQNSKSISKVIYFFTNSLHLFLPNISNIIISILIIRILSPEWWGKITILQLYLYVIGQICAWGNKDFLLKNFSQNPSTKTQIWLEQFKNRIAILIVCLTILFGLIDNVNSLFHLSLWIVFRYFIHSFEAIIQFNRAYIYGIVSEFISFIFIVLGILVYKHKIEFNDVLLIFTLGYLLKTCVLIGFYSQYFKNFWPTKTNYKSLYTLFPFMMIGLLGFVQQKSDLMSMAMLSNSINVAKYQVLSAFMQYAQAIPALIIGPYIKNIYRLNHFSFGKLKNKLIVFGFFISIFSTLSIYLLITYLYHFELSQLIYVLAIFNIWFTYLYTLNIFSMFRAKKQHLVMIISIITIIFNVVLCTLTINIWQIEGALIATTASQILTFLIYECYTKYYLKPNAQ